MLGHKTSPEWNDSGYLICKRCNSHEYYDYRYADEFDIVPDLIWEKGGLLFRPYYFFKGIYYKIRFFIERLYNKYILKSDLPF